MKSESCRSLGMTVYAPSCRLGLPSRRAAMPVVQLPANGSRIMPPGLVQANMERYRRCRGFCVGCLPRVISTCPYDPFAFNCVTPAQREALVRNGVKILKPTGDNAGRASLGAYQEWLQGGGGTPNGGARYSRKDNPNFYKELEQVNTKFNDDLDKFNENTKDATHFVLGKPSDFLINGGVVDKEIKLKGSKLWSKLYNNENHLNINIDELRNLPIAINRPIGVFNNYRSEINKSILTELKTSDGNILVAVTVGENDESDFDFVTTLFGKPSPKIVNWINSGYLTQVDKEKALDYLHIVGPIPTDTKNQALFTAANIVRHFDNSKF